MTALQAGSELSPWLAMMGGVARAALGGQGSAMFGREGLSDDEGREIQERLQALADGYEEPE